MARPGITYHEVSNAAQQQLAAGKTPTIESIRIALGSGSHSTLGPLLRTWKAQHMQTQQLASLEKIPEELVAALKGVWEIVMNQAQEKITHIHQESERLSLQLKHEIEDLQKNNREIEVHYLQTKEARDTLLQQKTALEEVHANTELELAAFKEKLSGALHNNQEKQSRIDELHHLNQQAQANLEHYRHASLEQRLADEERHEERQQQLEKMIAEINQELTLTKRQMDAIKQQHQQLAHSNSDLKNELAMRASQQATTEDKLAHALREIANKTEIQQLTQNQLLLLETKYSELVKLHQDLKIEHALTQQKIATLASELLEIKTQNKQLMHENWLLGQEKAEIHGQFKQLQTIFAVK